MGVQDGMVAWWHGVQGWRMMWWPDHTWLPPWLPPWNPCLTPAAAAWAAALLEESVEVVEEE